MRPALPPKPESNDYENNSCYRTHRLRRRPKRPSIFGQRRRPALAGLGGRDPYRPHFPKFTDGRAYSQAFLLRRRLGYTGEIRATGDVLIDQLVQMQRSGFTVAVLKEGVDASAAQRQFDRFEGFYQGDAVQPEPHFAKAA